MDSSTLTFKKISFDDLEFVFKVRNESREFLHDDSYFNLFQITKWFDKEQPDWYIIFLDSDTPIGYFRLSNYSAKNKNIYIGADLAKEFRGKGYAKQAYKEFIQHLFLTRDLHKITLEVLDFNFVAISLYQKLGFVETGRKPEEILCEKGYADSIIMTLFRRDWLNG